MQGLQELTDQFYREFTTQTAGVDFSDYEPDHLCYRVATLREYEIAKALLDRSHELLTEANVRGRPISTYRLSSPVAFGEKRISVLELPAPKAEQTYPTGLEHVEFVTNEPFAHLLARHPRLQDQLKIYRPPSVTEAVWSLPGMTVKLHYRSLERLIAIENKPAWRRQIVVFDLDGTLIDSGPAIQAVNTELLSELGVSRSQLQGIVFATTFQGLIEQFHLNEIGADEFASRWSEKMSEAQIALMPRARQLLENVQALGLPMVLWTARDRRSADQVLVDLDLRKFFSKVWTFDEPLSKPNVDGLAFLVEGRPPGEVHFIGDSKTDRDAALAFGCHYRHVDEVLKSDRACQAFVENLQTTEC